VATAGYKPSYFPCSYKGVSFQAMDTTSEHGRRGAEGEFPFGENTGYADLGRRIRTYTIRGRFATNDHIARAAALIAVCEAPGPGPLVHPTRGIIIVACRSLKVQDNPLEEQGVTYVDLDFVEANVWLNGFQTSNLIQTGLSIASLIAVTGASFNSGYQPRNSKPYNTGKVLATASTAITQIKNEYERAANRGNLTDQNTWAAVFVLERRAADITVLNDPEQTYRTLRLGMAALSAATASSDKYDAFLRLANENARASNLNGQDAISQDAVYSSVRTVAAGYMSRAVLETQNLNADQAFRAYEQISAILGTEIDAARQKCDNVLYLELRNFYTSMQATLFSRIFTLPTLVIYNYRGSTHALIAAYEIYNDAKRVTDLEQQNPGSAPWLLGPRVVAART
jgi:hypothetical protein